MKEEGQRAARDREIILKQLFLEPEWALSQ